MHRRTAAGSAARRPLGGTDTKYALGTGLLGINPAPVTHSRTDRRSGQPARRRSSKTAGTAAQAGKRASLGSHDFSSDKVRARDAPTGGRGSSTGGDGSDKSFRDKTKPAIDAIAAFSEAQNRMQARERFARDVELLHAGKLAEPNLVQDPVLGDDTEMVSDYDSSVSSPVHSPSRHSEQSRELPADIMKRKLPRTASTYFESTRAKRLWRKLRVCLIMRAVFDKSRLQREAVRRAAALQLTSASRARQVRSKFRARRLWGALKTVVVGAHDAAELANLLPESPRSSGDASPTGADTVYSPTATVKSPSALDVGSKPEARVALKRLLSTQALTGRFRRVISSRRLALQQATEISNEGGDLRSQGDTGFYSLEAMAARQDLQTNLDVVSSILRFWYVISDENHSVALSKLHRKEDRPITKQQYFEVFGKIYMALSPGATHEERQVDLEDDWNNDSNNGVGLTYAKFHLSVWEVADQFTDDTSAESMIPFLDELFAAITKPGPGGIPVLRSDSDVHQLVDSDDEESEPDNDESESASASAVSTIEDPPPQPVVAKPRSAEDIRATLARRVASRQQLAQASDASSSGDDRRIMRRPHSAPAQRQDFTGTARNSDRAGTFAAAQRRLEDSIVMRKPRPSSAYYSRRHHMKLANVDIEFQSTADSDLEAAWATASPSGSFETGSPESRDSPGSVRWETSILDSSGRRQKVRLEEQHRLEVSSPARRKATRVVPHTPVRELDLRDNIERPRPCAPVVRGWGQRDPVVAAACFSDIAAPNAVIGPTGSNKKGKPGSAGVQSSPNGRDVSVIMSPVKTHSALGTPSSSSTRSRRRRTARGQNTNKLASSGASMFAMPSDDLAAPVDRVAALKAAGAYSTAESRRALQTQKEVFRLGRGGAVRKEAEMTKVSLMFRRKRKRRRGTRTMQPKLGGSASSKTLRLHSTAPGNGAGGGLRPNSSLRRVISSESQLFLLSTSSSLGSKSFIPLSRRGK